MGFILKERSFNLLERSGMENLHQSLYNVLNRATAFDGMTGSLPLGEFEPGPEVSIAFPPLHLHTCSRAVKFISASPPYSHMIYILIYT